MKNLRHRYCIVGVGNTAYGHTPGYSQTALNVMAIRAALEDAGLTTRDLDGVLTKAPTSTFPKLWAAVVAEALRVRPNIVGTLDQAGATNIGLIQYAISCIELGQGEVVAMGTPREVQAHPGVIEAYLGTIDDVSNLRRPAGASLGARA